MPDPFVLLLVHHSHTDVGYTEVPQRIERWHADFIRQALAAVDAHPGFRWVCETFWGVEAFLRDADAAERRAFAQAVRSRRIGLSASYLNFSELFDGPLIRAVTARAARYGHWIGTPVPCAMTADVNGFGWAFADALLDAGVENLFTCVHTHHGMYPLGRTQVPFRWETADGRRLTVWSGEHYHYGNELGLVPGANSSYLIKDACDAATIFGDHRRVAEARIVPYVDRLRARGYPFDFAPVMASGLRNDNAPPNPAILDAVRWWNDAHGHEVRVQMATLEDVFERLVASGAELPVHRGDWPDWWSDGPASRPHAVRLHRAAQRDLDRLSRLHRRWPQLHPQDDLDGIQTELALFAEHTFSHSDAMSSPWTPMVAAIDATKDARAARAAGMVTARLDATRERLGGSALRPGLPLSWRVLNPSDEALTDLARLGVGHYEFEELGLGGGFEVRDAVSGSALPAQLQGVPRGGEVLVPLTLEAGAERRLELRAAPNGRRPSVPTPGGAGLRTPTVEVAVGGAGGLAGIRDARTGRDLLRGDAPHAPFQLVRDTTPVADRADVCGVRGRMGLNRKGEDALFDAARFDGTVRRAEGPVFDTLVLAGALAGASFVETEVRAWHHAPRLDVLVRGHKEGTWAPENLYVALPFTAGGAAETWIEKAGCALRPLVDQLPGTLTDYYAVGAGFASIAPEFGVVVLMPDQHLLQLGPLVHGERLLAGDPRLTEDPRHAYGWLMTNFWETNFAAHLGGFFEFAYTVLWGEDLASPERAFAGGRAALLGFESIRQGART